MTDMRADSVEAIALKVLIEKATARLAVVKGRLGQAMQEGDRTSARLTNGIAVGSVTYTKGSTKARLVNETQLTQWVLDNFPDDIVPTIRPSLLASLLSQAQKNGAPVTSDGELIPGVDIVQADGYLTVRPDLEQLPALVDAIRASRELALDAE